MDHVTSVLGIMYQLPHKFHTFYSTQGVDRKGWRYRAPMNPYYRQEIQETVEGKYNDGGNRSTKQKSYSHWNVHADSLKGHANY
jgi:hypothetical protein